MQPKFDYERRFVTILESVCIVNFVTRNHGNLVMCKRMGRPYTTTAFVTVDDRKFLFTRG